MTEKSNTSYKKQPIEITNPEIWNKVWIQVVACYWEEYDVSSEKTNNILFNILKKLNVAHIESLKDDFTAIRASKKGPIILKVKVLNERVNYDPEDMYQPTNGWKGLFGNLTIKLPPMDTVIPYNNSTLSQTKILSDYNALGLFFPIGPASQQFIFEGSDTNDSNQNSKETCSLHQRKEKYKTLIIKRLAEKIASTPKNNLLIETINKSEIFNHIWKENPPLDPNRREIGQKNDRGGSAGEDADMEWLHFVPRLVTYNWYHKWQAAVLTYFTSRNSESNPSNRMKALDLAGHKNNKQAIIDLLSDCKIFKTVLEDNLDNDIVNFSSLTNYPVLLDDLGYIIPKGLSIYLEYATELPQDDNGNWNPEAYVSELELAFPQRPRLETRRPIALADLVAMRSNQPFTTT